MRNTLSFKFKRPYLLAVELLLVTFLGGLALGSCLSMTFLLVGWSPHRIEKAAREAPVNEAERKLAARIGESKDPDPKTRNLENQITRNRYENDPWRLFGWNLRVMSIWCLIFPASAIVFARKVRRRERVETYYLIGLAFAPLVGVGSQWVRLGMALHAHGYAWDYIRGIARHGVPETLAVFFFVGAPLLYYLLRRRQGVFDYFKWSWRYFVPGTALFLVAAFLEVGRW